MIKLSNNLIKQKFYFKNLPRYKVIDTDMFIIDSNVSKDITFTDSRAQDYYRKLEFLKPISFSVMDEDLFSIPCRVFIDVDGKIYLGRLDDDYVDNPDILNSIIIYVTCYLHELVGSLTKFIQMHLMTHPGEVRKVKFLNINLPDKKMQLTIDVTKKIKGRKPKIPKTTSSVPSFCMMTDPAIENTLALNLAHEVLNIDEDITKQIYIGAMKGYETYEVILGVSDNMSKDI